jgi:nitrogen fixation NifU-like protein
MMNSSGEETFNFWKDHSNQFLEMALDASRRGRLEKAAGYGTKKGECGDTVEFFLEVKHNRITAVVYDLNGCLHTNACANTVAALVENKTVEEAWNISPEQIAEYLVTLPSNHFHCAELAAGAFYLALADYQKSIGFPSRRPGLR